MGKTIEVRRCHELGEMEDEQDAHESAGHSITNVSTVGSPMQSFQCSCGQKWTISKSSVYKEFNRRIDRVDAFIEQVEARIDGEAREQYA